MQKIMARKEARLNGDHIITVDMLKKMSNELKKDVGQTLDMDSGSELSEESDHRPE